MKIVVCGATGNQGGSVVKSLLDKGNFRVFALTRSSGSAEARQLKVLGAIPVEADYTNVNSLVEAFKGADGVFSVTQPWDTLKKRYDINKEIIQAKNMIWASREAGVKHLVFSSFINPFNEQTGCSFVDRKLIIESHLRALNIPHTIIRVPIYMENINFQVMKDDRRIRGNYNAATPVPYASLKDLAVSNAVFLQTGICL